MTKTAYDGAEGGTGRRWLVTGGAGFIGSNLCRFLLDRGGTVTAIDNFFTGKREHVARLEKHGEGRFRFVEGTILDADTIRAAAQGCEHVIHLAAQVSVQRSIDNPAETHEINTTGFLNVLDATHDAGAGRLVYASSCAVYGDNPHLPLAESGRATPMSPYAATKLANEVYAAGFAGSWRNLGVIGLRFFNIFGAWQDPSGGYAAVIPKWIDAFLSGDQPVLFGDGSAVRDFCHVDNVCEAIWTACELKHPINHGVFNIGTGVEMENMTMVEILLDTLGKPRSLIQHVKDREGHDQVGS